MVVVLQSIDVKQMTCQLPVPVAGGVRDTKSFSVLSMQYHFAFL
jgi:hypothetical protein